MTGLRRTRDASRDDTTLRRLRTGLAVPRSARPVQFPLDGDVPAARAALLVAGDDRPFALTGRWAGAAAIAGSEPVHVWRSATGVLDALDCQPSVDGAPPGFVGGGWFGILGYGIARELEALDPFPPAGDAVGEGTMAFYDHVLLLDGAGQWWFQALWTQARAAVLDGRLSALRQRLDRGVAAPVPAGRSTWRPTPGRRGHALVVAACRERIEAGDLFQANVSMRLRSQLTQSPADLFTRGAEALGPDRAAFVGAPWGAVASLSPELLVERHGDHVRSAPIKGTRPRSRDTGEAERTKTALLGAQKDRAEHVMIVDLVRNDLGRVCEYGSVRVEALARARPHVGVWHLVSDVTGRLRAGVGDAALVRAVFPPGSVTGAPKIAAINVISSLESAARRAFCGAIGFASPTAGLELNTAIRTVECFDGFAWLDVGGGIVADSDADAETEECLAKARPLLTAIGGVLDLGPAAAEETRPLPAATAPRPRRLGPRPVPRPDPGAGLLETVRVDDGIAVNLDGHLRRLAASQRTLFGRALPPLLAAAVAASARDLGRAGALRVVLDPRGDFTVEPRAVEPAGQTLVVEPVTVPGGLGAHKWGDRGLLAALESAVAPAAPLLVDPDGLVLETSRASVVLLRPGVVIAPPLDGRILPGTARARVLRRAGELGLSTEERPIPLADLLDGGGPAFACNALRGAVPLAAVGATALGAPDPAQLEAVSALAWS